MTGAARRALLRDPNTVNWAAEWHEYIRRAPNSADAQDRMQEAAAHGVSFAEMLRGTSGHPGDVGRDYENLHDWSD